MKNQLPYVILRRPLRERVICGLASLLFGSAGLWFAVGLYFDPISKPGMKIGGILFGCGLLIIAALWLWKLMDYVEADGHGILQRQGLQKRRVSWPEIGAFFIGDYNVMLFNKTQDCVLLHLDMTMQPAPGEGAVRSREEREEFESFIVIQMLRHRAEPLTINPMQQSELAPEIGQSRSR